MRNEKQKKGFKFNPADYDYMDNISMEEWAWEFIRRNEAYKQIFKPILNDINTIISRLQKYLDSSKYKGHASFFKESIASIKKDRRIDQIISTPGKPLIKKKFKSSELTTAIYTYLLYFIKACQVPFIEPAVYSDIVTIIFGNKDNINFFGENLIRSDPGLPNLKLNENRENGIYTLLAVDADYRGMRGDALPPLPSITDIARNPSAKFNYDDIFRYLLPTDMNDSYFFCFNMKSRRTDIEKAIKKILDGIYINKDKTKTRRHPANWKDYLMVYDLNEIYPDDFNKIASFAYPEEKNEYPNYPVTKKVRVQVNEAKSLINGKYKQYLTE